MGVAGPFVQHGTAQVAVETLPIMGQGAHYRAALSGDISGQAMSEVGSAESGSAAFGYRFDIGIDVPEMDMEGDAIVRVALYRDITV